MRHHFSLAALIVWAALIFLFSSFPNPPDAGGNEWQYELAHVVEYFVFGVLALCVFTRYRGEPLVVLAFAAWAVAVLYGMSDEYHQSFVPNRDSNWLDVGMDTVGGAMGVTLASQVHRNRRGTGTVSTV